ncbi:MAG: hypothetical protein HZB12_03460 [Candidatus Yonathbacteria bacterium]|nr:hypothetical protein [Candidatus Yonathbacteria bacterium]
MNAKTVQFKIARKPKTISVEFDASQFERVAATFGFFNPEFLKSLARSEEDFRKGRVYKFKSLKDLE